MYTSKAREYFNEHVKPLIEERREATEEGADGDSSFDVKHFVESLGPFVFTCPERHITIEAIVKVKGGKDETIIEVTGSLFAEATIEMIGDRRLIIAEDKGKEQQRANSLDALAHGGASKKPKLVTTSADEADGGCVLELMTFQNGGNVLLPTTKVRQVRTHLNAKQMESSSSICKQLSVALYGRGGFSSNAHKTMKLFVDNLKRAKQREQKSESITVLVAQQFGVHDFNE